MGLRIHAPFSLLALLSILLIVASTVVNAAGTNGNGAVGLSQVESGARDAIAEQTRQMLMTGIGASPSYSSAGRRGGMSPQSASPNRNRGAVPYNKSNGLLFKEFELILRPQQGAVWPDAGCAASDEAVAMKVTETLGISSSSFTVIAKVFDTVVMLVNTTGLTTADNVQVNATAMAQVIVTSVNDYAPRNNSDGSTKPPVTVYDIIGDFFVGQCRVYSAAFDYHPVKVPGYLRTPEQYDRTGFYVLGGLAGLCVVVQAVYGVLHWRRFDLEVLRDSDEQSLD